ncbi:MULTISPECIES: hypothetical protein [unclassified Ekhidna]|jgi:hypothetical protein|uniref:hypothetical protein n=1 Tax=unclassified Ekhidna TaxID=2632188 RepID=UPI0032DEFFA4
MNYRKFSQSYAKEIGGEFREYDENQSVIIVPLKSGRFQTVTGHITEHPGYNREVVHLKSKVCELSYDIPFDECLEASKDYPYTKFIIEDGFLKVEAINFLVNLKDQMVKEMIQEIAQHADDWELKITGKDIH